MALQPDSFKHIQDAYLLILEICEFLLKAHKSLKSMWVLEAVR